jgi:hypothetical protein
MSLKKNSGILRFIFGTPNPANPRALPPLGPVAVVLQCLGAGADVLTPDQDNQFFGPSPGHGIVGTFAGAAALQEQPGDVLSASLPNERSYIPASTKVFAFWVHTSPLNVGQVAVETQVVNSQIRAGANGTGNNSIVDANGAFYLASIRIAVVGFAPSPAVPLLAGELIVELQHSEHDVPGIAAQDQNAGFGT